MSRASQRVSRLAVALRRADRDLHAWAWIDDGEPSACSRGPLAGMPFGVKDIIDVRGMPTRHGCAAYAQAPPATLDAACVALLRRAGAVPVGKTVTAELAFARPGPTRNPWDLARTPGGSSSGSAAAVAVGMVPFALGTQTGGSVIRPAAYCGVVGFKASNDTVPLAGVKPVAGSFDSLGWFARDTAVALAVARVLLDGALPDHEPRTLRVALVAADAGAVVDPCARAALAQAVEDLRRRDVVIEVSDLGIDWRRLHELHRLVMLAELARNFLPERHSGSPLGARTRDAIAAGAAIDYRAWRAACGEIAEARRRAIESLSRYDAAMSLGAASAAPRGLASTGDSACQRGWSALGGPALLLPTTFDTRGLPLGVQFSAAPGADEVLLRLGVRLHPLLDRRTTSHDPSTTRSGRAPTDARPTRRRGISRA